MRTSWDNLVQHVGTKYGQDIRNDLNRKNKINLFIPVHSTEVLVSHATWKTMLRTGQSNIQATRWAQAIMIRAAAIPDPSDAELPMKIAIMDS